MQDLRTELQSFEGEEKDENIKRMAIDALKRMENWNLFHNIHEVCNLLVNMFYSCLGFCFQNNLWNNITSELYICICVLTHFLCLHCYFL